MLVLLTRLQSRIVTLAQGDERGQSTVEYALVILAAAALALLVVAWAARTGRIEALFDRVVDSVTSKAA
jgi:Flp pilus assembly pilin Flp